jgi:hypothetical protein
MREEYYERLGVSPDAPSEEISTAYRERLKEIHPDVSDANDAKRRTRRLIEAKEVLTDENERARYDRVGHERYVSAERGDVSESDPPDGSTDTVSDDPDTHTSRSAADGQGSRGRAGRGRTAGGPAGDGIDWESRAETDWDAVSEAVWQEVTDEAPSEAGTGHTASGSVGRQTNGSTATAVSPGTDPTGEQTTDSQRVAATTGEPTAGWYDGGDPSGSGPNSRSIGGTSGDRSWRGWAQGHKQGAFPPHRILSPIQTIVLTCFCFAAFPLLAIGSATPGFLPATRVVLATFLLFVVVVLVVIPQLGLVVFGSWALLLPVALTNIGWSLLGPESFVVFGITALSLGLSGLSWLLTRPPVL